MKRHYLPWAGILLLLIAAFPAAAQFEKGTTFFGGTIDGKGALTRSKIESDKGRSANHLVGVSLQWGKFTRQNLLIGIGLNARIAPTRYGLSSGAGNQTIKQFWGEYGVGPYLRWYKPLGEKLSFFVHHEAVFSLVKASRKEISGSSTHKETENGFMARLAIAPGISYRFKNRFALESDLNLMSLWLNYADLPDKKSFYVSSAFNSKLNSVFSLRAAWYLSPR